MLNSSKVITSDTFIDTFSSTGIDLNILIYLNMLTQFNGINQPSNFLSSAFNLKNTFYKMYHTRRS